MFIISVSLEGGSLRGTAVGGAAGVTTLDGVVLGAVSRGSLRGTAMGGAAGVAALDGVVLGALSRGASTAGTGSRDGGGGSTSGVGCTGAVCCWRLRVSTCAVNVRTSACMFSSSLLTGGSNSTMGGMGDCLRDSSPVPATTLRCCAGGAVM